MDVEVEFAGPVVEPGEVGYTGAVTVGIPVPADPELPVEPTVEELG